MQEVSGSIPLFSTKKALYFVGSTVLFFFVPAKRSGMHRSPCRRASDTPRSQSKPLSDLTLAVFSAPPAPCQGPPAYLYTSAVFLWARVDYASRAAKNSPPGCFCPFFCDGAAAVRIRPPSLREGYYKTETPVPGSDAGVLGGRGWIRTTEAEKQQIYSLSPLATREHAHILFAVIADCLYILSSEVAFVNYFFHGFSLFLSFSIFLRFTAIKALSITAKDPKTFSVLRSFWSW